MSPAELYDAVCAAYTARLELAKAATPGPWTEPEWNPRLGDDGWWIYNGQVGADEYAVGLTVPYNPRAMTDAEHIAANDPAATIRRCEADLATLEDHKPWYFDDFGDKRGIWYCRPCRHADDSPCGELTRRAKAELIEVPDG